MALNVTADGLRAAGLSTDLAALVIELARLARKEVRNGKDGRGIADSGFDAATGKLTLKLTDGSEVATADLRGRDLSPFESYMDALMAPDLSDRKDVSAIVNGRRTQWAPDPAGTALGGGFSPADIAHPEHWGEGSSGILLAAQSGKSITTRGLTYTTSLALSQVPKALDGNGVVKYGSGNALPRSWRYIDTAPSAFGDESSFQTAFNGDWSKIFSPRGVYVTGAATLGQPATGFQHANELAPYYLFMRNVDSGHNQSLTGNDGRTTWPGFRIRGMHSGQGGMMGFSTSIYVNGATRPGVTSFLANPAAANFSGSAYAGANGVYLNPLELNCEDQGFDVAAIGPVVNMRRTNKTGALQAFWAGMRVQSTGAEPINSAWQLSGKADTALDLTKADLSSGDEAAIALKAGHRIYFEASSANLWHKTANGDTWLAYNTANSALEMFVDGAELIRARTGGVLIRNTSLQIETGNLALLAAGGIVSINGQKVLGARQAAVANAATGTEITTINAILAALRTHGLIAT